MDHHRHLPTVLLGLSQVVLTGTMLVTLSWEDRSSREFLTHLSDRKERIMSDRWVLLDVEQVLQVTDNAILVRIGLDGDEYEEVWLPKSQVQNPDDYEKGDTNVDISITGWLAREKGLES